jgi:hypothetical protein
MAGMKKTTGQDEKARTTNRYSALIEAIFTRHANGTKPFEFEREELTSTAAKLKIVLPKNLGDSFTHFDIERACRNPYLKP